MVTVCGNPFQRTVTQLINSTLTLVNLSDRCLRCLRERCLGNGACRSPRVHIPSKWYWDSGNLICGACDVWVVEMGSYWTRKPVCAVATKALFWDRMRQDWDSMDKVWR